jgi:Na+/melibiose symporter-like transporter
MDGVNILATEAVGYMNAGRIVALCVVGLLCIFGFICLVISIMDDDTDAFFSSVGSIIILCFVILLIICSRPKKVHYYMTIEDTVNYIEFSEEYNVEKHIGDLYIATKLEKDD